MQRSSFFDSQCQTVEIEYVDWCKHLPQMVQKHSTEIQMMLPPRLQAFHKSMHAKLSKQDVLSVVELLKGIRLLQNDALRKIASILEELHQNIGSNLELLNLQSGWKGIPPNHSALQKPPRIGEGYPTSPRNPRDMSPDPNPQSDGYRKPGPRLLPEQMWDQSPSRPSGGNGPASLAPNGGMSSSGDAYDPDEGDEGERSFDEPTFPISNLSTLSQEPYFPTWERKFSPQYKGPTVRKLLVSAPVKSEFAKRRLTSILKHMGTKSGDMAIWVGGYKQMVGLFRHKIPISDLEDVTDEKDPRAYICHIGYMSNFILFFTSHCYFIVMNIDGTIEFFSPLEPLLTRSDSVTASLSQAETSCTILGTNEGKLIVISVDMNEKEVQGLYNEHHSARRISSLIWLDEQETTFACASFDKNISILRFANKEVEVLRTFNYDQSVSCCIKMGSLLVAAFGNACVSVIEAEQGKILTSLKLHRPKGKVIQDYAFINWVGFVHLGTYKELKEDLTKTFKHDQPGFEAFISRIRFVCKFDDNLLVVCGFPTTDSSKYKEIPYADKRPQISVTDSRRLPVIMERFDDRTIRLRVFTIDLPETPGPSDSGQLKPDDYVTWMSEIELSLTEEPEGGDQPVTAGAPLPYGSQRGDAN